MADSDRRYRVAIIGCGRPRGTEGQTGFARAYDHWRAYKATGRCDLVALADIRRENGLAFAESEGDPASPPAVYEDYRELLREARPEIVSICTWPALHAEMVLEAAASGAKAIHCEKPMAPTWGAARRMAEAAHGAGAFLMFTHQRRFEGQFRAARRLLREGAIGDLVGMECHCSNLFDWGTHWFDMMNFYNGDVDVQWVMGQIDLREGQRAFGALIEDQGLSHFRYANGVWGLLVTGGGGGIGAANRLIGREGMIEVGPRLPEGQRVPLRVKGRGDADWRVPDISGDRPGPGGPVAAATADLLRCMEQGGEPELSVSKALRATEMIFATYESARRRARVDLPLEIDDSPLIDLFERGEIGAAGRP